MGWRYGALAAIWATSVMSEAEAKSRQPPEPVSREWLIGLWVEPGAAKEFGRTACNSDSVTAYDADGQTRFWGGSGTWRLDGNRLSETVTEISEAGDPDLLNRTTIVRIKRIGPDEGVMRTDDGWQPLLRCRPGDIVR